MPALLARLRRFAGTCAAISAKAARWRSFIGTSSSAQARWLIKVSISSPSSSPLADLAGRQAEPVDAGVDHDVAGPPRLASSARPGAGC